MASRPLIKESLSLLHVCGINPHKYSAWSKFRAVVIFVSLSFFSFEIFLECILNWKGINSIEDLTVFVGVFQLVTKFFLISKNRTPLIEVLNKMELFWATDKYSKGLQNEIQNTCKIVRISVRFMLITMICIVTGFCAKAILSTSRKLPFHTYHPVDLNQSPNYELSFVFQLWLLTVGITALIGLDAFFIALIFNITFELKILKEAFLRLQIDYTVRGDTEENLMELYQAIDHHNLILDCTKDVRNIYSALLLNVYFYDMLCICTGLLFIIVTGFPPTFESFLQYGLFVIFYLFQLFFYCTAGSYLTSESEGVSTIVFGTDWWIKTQPELRKSYVMIIQRANKVEKLTAGGMFDLNLDSFTKVIKTTLSLFTLVEAVYKNN